jgi:6-phosphogluconolactonase
MGYGRTAVDSGPLVVTLPSISRPSSRKLRMALSVQVVTPDSFTWTVSGALADTVRSCEGDRISVALSGGRTVGPIYQALSEIDLPWDRIDLFQTDERAVDPNDRASNYRTIKTQLLDRLPSPPGSVTRMEAERSDLDIAAADYASRLPASMDFVLLGIGEDCHICSIFPGQKTLWTTQRLVVPSETPEGDRRLTMTPAYLSAASTLVVAAAGARKADAVREALSDAGSEITCPARLARSGDWVLDQEAAQAIRYL